MSVICVVDGGVQLCDDPRCTCFIGMAVVVAVAPPSLFRVLMPMCFGVYVIPDSLICLAIRILIVHAVDSLPVQVDIHM